MATKTTNHWVSFMPFLISNVVITLLGMITSVGIPYITDSFGLTSQQAPWVVTLTSMASAILAPLMGWLGDKKGIKVQMMTGILFLLGANLLCAITDNFILFCAGRFFSGIGLAASYPACMSYVADFFPADKKVGGFAILGACISMGSGLGPTLIGILLSVFTWRQLFLYSELLALVLLAYILFGVKRVVPENAEGRKLDGIGMGTLFVGIGALISLLTLSTQYGWGHPLILTLLAVSAVFLFLFFRHESKAPAPMMDVSLFRNKRFIIPALTGLYIYAVKCYYSTALPYYFTIGREMPSNVSGLLVTIYFLAAFPLSFLLGRLNRRFTTRALAIFGVVTWVVGMAMLLPVTAATSIGYFVIALIIPSIGIAILGGMPNACALKGIPPEKTGAASGTISLLSNLGACLISALVIPYLSVFDRRADGTPDYVAAFPKVSMIMLVLLIGCLLLTFFFPRDKSEG